MWKTDVSVVVSSGVSELMENNALKNQPERSIVLSKTLKAQALREKIPTITPHINFGKVEAFNFRFTNIVIQFITQILLKYSSQSLIPVKGNFLTVNLVLD